MFIYIYNIYIYKKYHTYIYYIYYIYTFLYIFCIFIYFPFVYNMPDMDGKWRSSPIVSVRTNKVLNNL